MDIKEELTEIINLLEADIPANPASIKNDTLEKGLQRELKRYFKHLDDALSIDGLERIYYRNVKQE